MHSQGREDAVLEESLQASRRELAAAYARLEALSEQSAAADRATAQALDLSRALDAHLTRTETVATGPKGWLKRRVVPNAATPDEVADTRELRASPLFDGPWYLRTYPEVVATGMSPALHYLRLGAAEGKDPGPDFSTNHYVSGHLTTARRKTNPLLDHLRTHR